MENEEQEENLQFANIDAVQAFIFEKIAEINFYNLQYIHLAKEGEQELAFPVVVQIRDHVEILMPVIQKYGKPIAKLGLELQALHIETILREMNGNSEGELEIKN